MGATVFPEPAKSVEDLEVLHAKRDSLITQLFIVD